MGISALTRPFTVSFLILLALALTGCATTNLEWPKKNEGCYVTLDNQLKLLDLKLLFHDLASDLCQNKTAHGNNNDPRQQEESLQGTLLVTDFVDLKSLKPKPAGILMGELMRSSLNSACGYNIQQAELSSYFSLTDKGLAVLTRNSDAIRQDNVSEHDFVVGTFNHSPDKLILFVKKFDLESGTISSISSKEIDFDCSGDRVSYRIR
jgi:hypothetical protein